MQEKQEKLGKYSLVRHIATGGMAEIWLAEQVGPGGFTKQVVIKRVLAHLSNDHQFTDMFLDEARLVAQLTHPNIGQIHELGEIEDTYFIAMEYIDGLDLSDLIGLLAEQGAAMPPEIAAYIVSQTLLALDYAHNFVDRGGEFIGLVHRDVTPHNIIVSNDGAIKLVDFGVAKAAANQSKTQTGAVKGKYAYMAPEQINSEELDRRVDVFAAGVVLYEILTGQRPFGEDLVAINAILNAPTPDARAARADVPQTLVNILNVALQKDRQSRYQSARAMMEDLEDYLRACDRYVGQRDLAAFVRALQGKEMTDTFQVAHVTSGPRARITEREGAVDTKEREALAVATASASPPSDPAPASRPSTLQTEAPDTLPASDEKGSEDVGLMVAFGLVVLLILGAGITLLVIAISPSSQDATPTEPVVAVEPPATDTPPEPPEAEEQPDPSALRHKDGLLFFLDATERSKVHYEGTYIGDTRLPLTLRPGSYELVFEVDGKQRARRIEVTRENEMKTILVKL